MTATQGTCHSMLSSSILASPRLATNAMALPEMHLAPGPLSKLSKGATGPLGWLPARPRRRLCGVRPPQAPDPPNLQMMLANGWALKPNGVVEMPDPQNPNWNVLMISFDDSVRAINVKRHVERAIFWGTRARQSAHGTVGS